MDPPQDHLSHLIRLGAIPYLNCRPYYEALRRGAVAGAADLVWGLPAEVNRGLLEGGIDVGPISTAAWARAPGLFDVVADLAIASAGPIRSILLVTRLPWENLGGAEVACDSASETSTTLLLVLSRRTHARPVVPVPTPAEEAARLERGAALLIGDAALRLGAAPPAGARVYDLGAMWDAATGLPMTFAHWVVRRDARARDAGGVDRTLAALRESLAWGEAHLDDLAADAPVPHAEALAYLRALSAARIHPRRAEGLRAFLDLLGPTILDR